MSTEFPAVSQFKPPDALSIRSQGRELPLLETLKLLLDQANDALARGDLLPMPEVSNQIVSISQQLMTLWLEPLQLRSLPAEQVKRRKLLAELDRQQRFCRAMLRRWRRCLALRQQLLDLQSEPEPYTKYGGQMELP